MVLPSDAARMRVRNDPLLNIKAASEASRLLMLRVGYTQTCVLCIKRGP